ncbi:MAG: hypothetical protein GY778_14925 [bacterium]|nr:hypothetical protein [bacterium]
MGKSRLTPIVAVALLVGAAANVRADLHSAVAADADVACRSTGLFAADARATPAVDLGRLSYAGESPFTGLTATDWAHGGLAMPLGPTPAGGAHSSPDEEVRELPALPGSARLFLSAMLSVGGWHLVRSARHIHLGAMPEWYHTGGPDQIGHAVPFDLDFSASPLCCFVQPAGERPYLYHVRRELRPCRAAQSPLIIAAPRGPPGTS